MKKHLLKNKCEKERVRSFPCVQKLQCRYRIVATLVCFVFGLCACEEYKFPVTDVPGQFEFIPPSDVDKLAAEGADGQIKLTWNVALSDSLKAIHVTNQNTGQEQVVGGTDTEVVFTGLTNYEKYTFMVKTENKNGQLAYGVTISAKPWVHDNVSPGTVIDLTGYKMGDETAFAVWKSPEDNDVKEFRIELGTSSTTVDAETTSASIMGDITQPLRVYAIDYSGNFSAAAETLANAPIVTIDGYDDGADFVGLNPPINSNNIPDKTTEYIRIHKDPVITGIDGYVLYYDGAEVTKTTSEVPAEVETLAMPMQQGKRLWVNNDAKTDGYWLVPVQIGIMSCGKEISRYDYLTYNNVPGTLQLTTADFINNENRGNGGAIKRNNDGNLYTSLLGNNDGPEVWCTYTINVLEDGDYDAFMFYSNEANKPFWLSVDGGEKVEGKTGIGGVGTGNWDSYGPSTPVTLSLTKGQHELRVDITPGGWNCQKIIFKKK